MPEFNFPFIQAEEQRKSSAQQLVSDGELSPDVFAEDLEEIPDMESEYAEDFANQLALDDEEDDSAAVYDDDDDGEQWVERIVELNRVTKVRQWICRIMRPFNIYLYMFLTRCVFPHDF